MSKWTGISFTVTKQYYRWLENEKFNAAFNRLVNGTTGDAPLLDFICDAAGMVPAKVAKVVDHRSSKTTKTQEPKIKMVEQENVG